MQRLCGWWGGGVCWGSWVKPSSSIVKEVDENGGGVWTPQKINVIFSLYFPLCTLLNWKWSFFFFNFFGVWLWERVWYFDSTFWESDQVTEKGKKKKKKCKIWEREREVGEQNAGDVSDWKWERKRGNWKELFIVFLLLQYWRLYTRVIYSLAERRHGERERLEARWILAKGVFQF